MIVKWILCFVLIASCLLSAAPRHALSSGGRQTVPVKAPAEADLADTVNRMLEEIAAKKVWPGFDPSTWPLALYDGEKTFLLRHPNPPAEFKPVTGRPGVLICPGRYPDVRANSTCDIAGVRTATLIATSGVERAMPALIEETFHVFWRARHTVFRPNEMARYAYPLTDAENLAGLLAESEALARALDAGTPGQAWRWVAAALEQRSGRRLRLDEESATFETHLEMLEGPANFVAECALGGTAAGTALLLRRQDYSNAKGKWKRGLEEIRWRFYHSGAAMAWLLERFSPGWKERLDAEPGLTMQSLLEIGLTREGGAAPSAYTEAEKESFRAAAHWAIGDLARRRSELRAEIEARGGVRLVVEVAPGAEPLQLARFDPISLFVLGDGQVAHASSILLADVNGSVELTNPDFVWGSFGGVVGLTESAGRRPLGDGTRRLTVFGIKGQPKVERQDGTVTIEVPGLRLNWKGAEVETEGAAIKVKVGSGTAAAEIERVLAASGLDRAKARFEEIRKRPAGEFTVVEKEFNALGYRLLRGQKPAEAKAVFRMNLAAFPDSWNAWDSLAESHFASGELDLAEKAYLRSLELNPQNENAKGFLAFIRGTRLNAQRETKVEGRFKPGEQTGLKGPYLGQKTPGLAAELFAPGIASTAGNFEFAVTFSPDGRELYFTSRPEPDGRNAIVVCRWEKDGWTAPQEASFAAGGTWSNEPFIAPDGKHVYFGSQRPKPGETEVSYGIWVCDRTEVGWSAPRYHGPGMFVTADRSGNLYMTDITNVAGGGIIRYPWSQGAFGKPERLGGGVNGPGQSDHACISPDGSFIVFDATRPGGQGGEGDLYVCFKRADGSWGEAFNLGNGVNTDATNFCPSLSPDGKYLFFGQNRDIFWVSAEVIERLRPK